MTFLIVGQRRVSVEFVYGVISYFFILCMHHYLIMKPGELINFCLYLLSLYVAMLFIGLVRSNPGHLNESHKKATNQCVTELKDHTFSFIGCNRELSTANTRALIIKLNR